MTQTIDLDFYIPAKDSEKYIRHCLESIFKQTLLPRSVTLFLHTPCQDKTRAIAEEFPVKIHEVNVPLSDVRNIAIRELTSEWIGCCDADVVLEPDWLEQLWGRKEGYTLISGNTQEQIKTFGDRCRSILSPHNWGNYDVDNPYNFAPDMIAKRSRLLEIGSYKRGLFNYEDSEICQRLKLAGDLFYYVANARAKHIREDDFPSWLNQRWSYSFPRQKELFETPEKYKNKITNNIVLTTTLFQKLILQEESHKNLIEVLQMPIHHFNKDLAYIEKNNPSIAPNIPFDFFLKHYSLFFKHAYETLFNIPDSSTSENPYAIDNLRWQNKIDSILHQSWQLFRVDLKSSPVVDILECEQSGIPEKGIVYYRQKVYPNKEPILTCKDTTEFVASFKKKLLWTETFQGTTMIGFETPNS